MFSLLLRRIVLGVPLRILVIAVAALNGEAGVPGGSEYRSSPPNARLWLARARDLQRAEVKVLAERIGSDPLELCVLGADVRIERAGRDRMLLAPSTAVIGQVIDVPGGSFVTCEGPGVAGPRYYIG